MQKYALIKDVPNLNGPQQIMMLFTFLDKQVFVMQKNFGSDLKRRIIDLISVDTQPSLLNHFPRLTFAWENFALNKNCQQIVFNNEIWLNIGLNHSFHSFQILHTQ